MGRFDALLEPAKPIEEVTVQKPLVSPIPKSPENEYDPKENTQLTRKLAKKQNSLLAKKQTSKEVSKHTSQLVDSQTSKEASQQGSKLLKKFGSYLPPETMKALKRYAFENDREVYDVLKEAIDLFLDQNT